MRDWLLGVMREGERRLDAVHLLLFTLQWQCGSGRAPWDIMQEGWTDDEVDDIADFLAEGDSDFWAGMPDQYGSRRDVLDLLMRAVNVSCWSAIPPEFPEDDPADVEQFFAALDECALD